MVNVIEVTADERVIDITVASYADLYASATAASVSADAAAASELAAGLSEVNAGASEAASAASAAASDASAVASAASAAAALIDADRAEAAAASISLEVDDYAALIAITSGDLAVGEYVRISGTNHIYQRVASGGIISGSGVTLNPMPFAFAAYDASCMGLALNGVTDDSVKIQALGDYVIATGGGAVFAPAGDMRLNNRLVFDLPATTTFASGYFGFSFVGQGMGVSRFILATSNTDGGIKITRNSRPQVASIQDVGFYSNIPIGTTAADTTNNGIGIYMASNWNKDNPTAMGYGTQPHRQVSVKRCFVGSDSGLAFGRWGGMLAVENGFFADVTDNSFESNHWNDVYDATPVYENAPLNGERGYSFGIDIYECYTPNVVNNRIKTRAQYCARLWSDQFPAFEDFAFGNNIVDGKSERGLVVECTDVGYTNPVLGEPGGRIWANHFNAHRFDVTLKNIRHVSFTGNFTHLATQADLDGWYKYADESGLRLQNVQAAQIVSNSWQEGGHFTDANNCSRAVVINADCTNITFDNNTHGSVGIAYDCASSEAMSITFGPGETFGFRQGDGNWRYPEIYHLMRTGIRQRVHAPPLDWTPVLTIGGSSVGITYSTRTARITRMGDTALIEVDITLTSKGGLTGFLAITGAPEVPISAVSLNTTTYAGTTVGFSGQIQFNKDIAFRKFDGSVLAGGEITDAFSVKITGLVPLAGNRNSARTG